MTLISENMEEIFNTHDFYLDKDWDDQNKNALMDDSGRDKLDAGLPGEIVLPLTPASKPEV